MSTSRNEKDNGRTLSGSQKKTIAAIILLVVGLWGTNWLLFRDKGLDERGTFGDMFGAVNALFSGLAFAGIIYTILLQRNELELQREEIRATRDEFIQQNETFRLQRFENTFFNMLNLQNDIVSGLRSGIVQYRKEGREVIATAQESLKDKIRSIHQTGIKTPVPEDVATALEVIEKNYHSYYDNFERHLNHYYRNLYHTFKFIYSSQLSSDEKKFYASIARAQLSQTELYLIAFNAVIDGYGYPKFTFLMKEFDILQNFGWDDIKYTVYGDMIKHVVATVENPFKSPVN